MDVDCQDRTGGPSVPWRRPASGDGLGGATCDACDREAAARRIADGGVLPMANLGGDEGKIS